MSWCRQAVVDYSINCCQTGKRCNDAGEYLSNPVRIAGDAGVEKSLDDNLERQAHHVAMNVADFTMLPIGNQTIGKLDHDVAVGADSLAMKCRLPQPSLPFPGFTLAVQQAVSNQPSKQRRALISRLDEVLRVSGDDVFDVVGVVEEVSSEIQKTHAH